MGHHRAVAELVERLDDDRQVRVAALGAEDRGASHAVEQLEDRDAMLVHEGAQRLRAAGHQHRRGELRELCDCQLLVVAADRGGVVVDLRALAHRVLEQVGGVHVLHVEGRVLAHQRGVEGRHRLLGRLAERVPGAVLAGGIEQAQQPRMGHGATAGQRELVLFADEDRVAAPVGLDHHREGRVLVGRDVLERVEDDQDAHR